MITKNIDLEKHKQKYLICIAFQQNRLEILNNAINNLNLEIK